MSTTPEDDEAAIHALVHRQFASLNWAPGQEANWLALAGDFHSEALLFPSARPSKSQSVEAFVTRMKSLAQGVLHTFHEEVLGTDITVFGNVAVAVASCRIMENGETESRSVEMMLLVKSEGRWQIAAQAWDPETQDKPIPPRLLERPDPA